MCLGMICMLGGLTAGCFVRRPLSGEHPLPRPAPQGPPVEERDISRPEPEAKPVEAEPFDTPRDGTKKPSASGRPATPGRGPSQRLVDEGVSFIHHAEYERALYKFEEAISIDPSNGEAYYYMAQVQTELGAYDEAAGLLDKAESLLGLEPPWGERITSLRQQIDQGDY